jgi:hypothetical protein
VVVVVVVDELVVLVLVVSVELELVMVVLDVLLVVLRPRPGGGFAAPPVIGSTATAPSENTTSKAKALAVRDMAATFSRWCFPLGQIGRQSGSCKPRSRDVPISRNRLEPRYRPALHRPGVDRLL